MKPFNRVSIAVSNLLKDLGISAGTRGYGYLCYAVEYSIIGKSAVHYLTKELYPAVASAHDSTPSRVECAMRNAIEKGWLTGTLYAQQDVFRNTIDSEKGKPTNGQFIATVADYIQRVVLAA